MDVAIESNNQHLLPWVFPRIWMRQNIQQSVSLNRDNNPLE